MKRHLKRKLLSLLLAAVMLCMTLSVGTFTASSETLTDGSATRVAHVKWQDPGKRIQKLNANRSFLTDMPRQIRTS